MLLNFMKEKRPFEKPNAQLYYRRCLSETGADCDWTILFIYLFVYSLT